jgi:deoxyribodipyrimidine photo-lyase
MIPENQSEIPVTLFWFRRDLRLSDNAGLHHALRSGNPVLPIFIFDKNILEKLENKTDRRVEFIHHYITSIKKELEKSGSSLMVLHEEPKHAFETLISRYKVAAVYTNNDYEPYARERDESIRNLLTDKGISFHTFKDHVVFERNEIMKPTGEAYTVFTPYSKTWKIKFNGRSFTEYKTDFNEFFKIEKQWMPSLEDLGFQKTGITIKDFIIQEDVIKTYHQFRDYPAENGSTKLGVHLRFGTLSIRKLSKLAGKLNETFLNELIWREFFMSIIYHHPRVVNESFKPLYDQIEWLNNEEEFGKWCEGQTGIPLVDAGMRELNATGHMHNRVRMVVASFLVKNLLIDWRWGEAYFAARLLDYELSSNNGNWQWAAGTGCDAAPYFRVFNPQTQQEKFDPDLKYVKKWVPEYGTKKYPKPMVDLNETKERCLLVYQKAIQTV